MGLNQVRDLTRRTQAKILHERPYASLEDFLLRVDPRPREAQNLVKAGALNCFGHEEFLLQRLKELGQSGNQLRQLSLFSLAESAASDEPWTIQQRAAAQEAVLGLSVDHHPLELVQAELEATGVISTAAVASHLGQKIRLAGIRQSWRRRRRLGNTSYYELIFEDREGQCIVLLAPSLYRRSRQLLQQPVVLVVAGEIIAPDEVDEPLLLARQVWPVSSTVNGSGG
jgi:error-prone DNA polymerase